MFSMLPKLKSDRAINPAEASKWLAHDKNFLPQLVKSLDTSGSIEDVGRIDSIPDVWARPLLFQMALYDDQRAEAQQFVAGLHERVLGEWRALLAMLALRDIRHLDIRAEAVDLTEKSQGSLSQVLEAMAPQETISRENSWKNLNVLFYQGKIIGITSPTTLVAAAADYQSAFQGTLTAPWSTDGITLVDPIPQLSQSEVASLHVWLEKLREGLRALPMNEQESPLFTKLMERLSAYCEDTGKAPLGSSRPLLADQFDLRLDMGVFRLLAKPIKGRAASPDDSAVRLMAKERSPKQQIILASPDMARDFASLCGVPAAKLVVWPGVTANEISEKTLGDDHGKIGSVALKGTEYRRPEEFFTDQMAVLSWSKPAFPGARRVPGSDTFDSLNLTPILPIRQELLEYFTPQEISERIMVECVTDYEMRIHFSFPLSGPDGAGVNYRFTKTYSTNDQSLVFSESVLPVIELWPNIRCNGWDRYYLYYENTWAQNVEAQGLGVDFLYVCPWMHGKEDIAKDVPRDGLSNRYTARLEGFPEALHCNINAPSSDGIGAQIVDAGFVLLKEPTPVTVHSNITWNVGIDFGTSSTMIYCREGEKAAKPLPLVPNLYQVTESGVFRSQTIVDFIPFRWPSDNNGSFLSIFHVLTDHLDKDISPLKDGHVFLLAPGTYDIYQAEARRNRIDANLKWKDDDIGRRRVSAYVKQICMQVAAEAVRNGAGKITWNFSYPTAFSAEQQDTFQLICQRAADDACKGTPLASSKIVVWPESKASAYHFNKLGGAHGNFTEGAICLDIGAGTTDISVISGQPSQIVYHTSIQFAGRYLFHPIYHNYNLLSSLLEEHRLADIDLEHRLAIIDADMRENGEKYLENLPNIAGRPEVKQVLQEMQLSMAGIFYYLGTVLTALREAEAFKENHLPDVFVGGNGARAFHWMTGGTWRSDSPFVEVLRHAIAASAEMDSSYPFRIMISDQPKIEVSSGMVADRPVNDQEFYDEGRQRKALLGDDNGQYKGNFVIAGEGFQQDGESFDKHALIFDQDISDGIQVDGLPELMQFIDRFNREPHTWADGVEITENQWGDIQRQVYSYFVSEKGKDTKKILVEPVFIRGLKELMEIVSHE